MQYGIDYGYDTLVTIANNAGDLATVGSLGIDTDTMSGFDIYTAPNGTNTAYAILGSNKFYTINLGTGAATQVSSNFGAFTGVYSLAVTPSVAAPEPGSACLALLGLLPGAAWLRRRRS